LLSLFKLSESIFEARFFILIQWPKIKLYPPDNGPCEASAYEYLDHQLEQPGLYTIVIEDHMLNDEGTYNISLTKIPPDLRPGIYNPYPPNGTFVININGSFRWDPVAEATGYDLYFGEDVVQPLTKIGDNLPSPSMPFPKLERGKIYYWHVVAKRPDGGQLIGYILVRQRDFLNETGIIIQIIIPKGYLFIHSLRMQKHF